MAAPLRYPRPPVELAGAVEAYLYDCAPAEACGVCAALVRELAEARAAKQWSAAYDAAAEVRNHPHGDGGPIRRIRKESEETMGKTGGNHSGKPDTSNSDGHRDRPPGPTKPHEPPKK